jgi:hypothetical protein
MGVNLRVDEGWMIESDTAIRCYVTKPKIFDEAIHFRAREGTKARIDALRGEMRQGDFIRLLLEEALDRREGQPRAEVGKDTASA